MLQLINITLHKHPIIGYTSLNFNNENANPFNGVKTTVVIGPNGIGKSYLLKAIVDVLRVVDALVNRREDVKMPELGYRFGITYMLDGIQYSVTNIHQGMEPIGRNVPRQYLFKRNGLNVHVEDIRLPQSVIASSMTIADKFPTPSMGIYEYRGVRSEKTPSMTGTRTLVRKAVIGIIDSLAHKHTTRDELKLLLESLGFQPRMHIKYKVRYKENFLTLGLTPEGLEELYVNWKEHFKGRSGEVWGTKFYKSIRNNPEKINIVCRFLNRCAQLQGQFGSYSIIYDVLDWNNTLVEDAEAIKLLTNLDILTFPEIKVYKQYVNDGYEMIESSSGETQQLCQFISIMSAIEPNSLVLIDEPENSSHPNWQMSYIDWLQQIFHNYSDCHFVIATHSHFLLTDMNPEWSKIVALQKEDNRLIDIADDVNTYCWSTDDILYRVFHVRTTRNRAFESDAINFYKLITDGKKNSQEAKMLYSRPSKFVLPGDDPLLKLIKMGE